MGKMSSQGNFNYKLFNSIDYIGEENQPMRKESKIEGFNIVDQYKKMSSRRKRKISIILIWILSTIALSISSYYCYVGTVENEAKLRQSMIDALEDVIQKSNVTLDDKFLKRFDRFLYKRKGWLTTDKNVDFAGWIALTCNSALLWIISTSILIRKKITDMRGS
jgi:hypothetical protein